MRKLALISMIACAALAFGHEAQAQQPAAPASVPDQMPFDIPYGPSITADRAAEVVKAVMAEATRGARNWKLAVAVVDTNGELVYFYKMDQTQTASIVVAQEKARSAARYRRATEVFFKLMQETGGSVTLTLDSAVASPGGIPLVEGGQMIGAIGCSGATGAQDHVACQAGADLLK